MYLHIARVSATHLRDVSVCYAFILFVCASMLYISDGNHQFGKLTALINSKSKLNYNMDNVIELTYPIHLCVRLLDVLNTCDNRIHICQYLLK